MLRTAYLNFNICKLFILAKTPVFDIRTSLSGDSEFLPTALHNDEIHG